MVSARGLLYGSENTARLLATCPEDSPLLVQLFGSEPEELARAVLRIRERGLRYFDLNAGCSVRKVVRSGAGAALLRDPVRLLEAVRAMADAAGWGMVGVKLRSGWNAGEPVAAGLGPDLERAGAGWLTLHPRFAEEGFSGSACWDHVKMLRSAVSIPVVGSGDLFTAEDAGRFLRVSGADGVMFARGALQWPPVFKRFRRLEQSFPPATGNTAVPEAESGGSELSELVRRHVQLCRRYDDSRRSLLKMRSAMTWYLRGFSAARHWRRYVVASDTWSDFERIADRLAREADKNG
jgi:tRNA-dihydrouridine synthase B